MFLGTGRQLVGWTEPVMRSREEAEVKVKR
jgi:hypothetical protein